MNKQEKNLKEFLNTCKGNAIDVCTYFYIHYIKNTDEKESINNLIGFLNNDFNSNETFDVEPKYQIDDSIDIKGVFKFIGNIITNLAKDNMSVFDFYKSLLCKLNDKSIFESDLKRGIAILAIKLDHHIPYFKLDSGLKMDNTEYQRITEDKIDVIKKAIFIINADLEQKTEVSSLLLKLINEEPNPTSQAVILSHIISYFDYRCQKLQEVIDDLKSSIPS